MSTAADPNLRQNFRSPRGALVPAWYTPHSEEALDREVFHDGRPMGFRVRDVLIERRWAIDRQGSTLPAHEFEELYKKWHLLDLTLDARGVPHGNPIHEQAALVSVPTVDQFVNKEPDAEGKLHPIGHDENVSAYVKSESYKHTGESQQEYEARVSEESEKREHEKAREAQMKLLLQMRASDQIDDAKLARMVKELYGEAAKEVEAPPETDAPDDPKAPEAPKAKAKTPIKARCGKVLKGGRHLHERKCETCKRLASEEGTEVA